MLLSGNADFQSAVPRIHSLVEKLHGTRHQLLKMWHMRKTKLEQCYQLRLFQQDANKVHIFEIFFATATCIYVLVLFYNVNFLTFILYCVYLLKCCLLCNAICSNQSVFIVHRCLSGLNKIVLCLLGVAQR